MPILPFLAVVRVFTPVPENDPANDPAPTAWGRFRDSCARFAALEPTASQHDGGEGTALLARPFDLKLCVSYLTIDDATFGLSGFTSRVRVFGMMMRSMSSIGIAPSKT